jgi:hypothetical protein
LGLFGGLTLFYTGAGTYISNQLGEHYVDEGHYLVQAISLYEDRDLNIRNNFGFDVDEAIRQRMEQIGYNETSKQAVLAQATHDVRRHLHISFRSSEDRWHSWHPYGLSLLLAPTMGSPLWIRQLLLGVLAATGVYFSFLSCIAMGRSVRYSLFVCLFWGLSTYYFVFAVRALPEALGATLFATALYSAIIARQAPIGAFALLIASCAFMPLAHPRFLICAGLAGLFFYWRVFVGFRPSRSVIIAYVFLLFMAAAGVLAYLLINHAAYQSLSAYPPLRNILGIYPEGRWLLLFSERGLLFGLPAAAALLPAAFYAAFKDASHRSAHITGIIGFVIMLFLMGAVESWDGGPTMYGRYLLVCLPGLLPGCVYALERVQAMGRRWIIFLFLFSASFTLICMTMLPLVGVTMLRLPWQAIRQAIPLLAGLFFPYQVSDILIGRPHYGIDAFTSNYFSLLLLTVSMLLILPIRRSNDLRRRMSGAIILIFVAVSGWLHLLHGQLTFVSTPTTTERHLARALTAYAAIDGDVLPIADLNAYANRFGNWRPMALTSGDLGHIQKDAVYSKPHLPPNDWAQRNYRWLTLIPPSHPGIPGPREFRLSGRVVGDGVGHLAIRQGRHTLLEQALEPDSDSGMFTVAEIVHTPSLRGHLYILIRLEGEGTLSAESAHWAPLVGAARNESIWTSFLRELPAWVQ